MLKNLLTLKNILAIVVFICFLYISISYLKTASYTDSFVSHPINNKLNGSKEYIHDETYISPMHSHLIDKKKHYHEFKQPPPEDTCPAVMKTVYGTDYDAPDLSNKEKKIYGNKLIKNFNNIKNARNSCLSELEQIGEVKKNTNAIIDKNLDKMQVDLGVINPKLAYNCCIQTECKGKIDDAFLECKQECCNTFSCANFPVEPVKQLETVVNEENYEQVNNEEEGINSESFPNYTINTSEEVNIPIASNIASEDIKSEEPQSENIKIEEETNFNIDSEIEQNINSITNKINKLNQRIAKQNIKSINNPKNNQYIDINSTEFNQAQNKDNVINYDIKKNNQFINVNKPSNSFNNYSDFKIKKNTESIIPDDNLNISPQKLGLIVPSGFNNV